MCALLPRKKVCVLLPPEAGEKGKERARGSFTLSPEFSKNFASLLLSSLRLFLQKLQKKKRCRLLLGRTPVGRQLRPEEKEEQGEKEEK